MKQVILALDQGTTGSTALIFDGEGRCLGKAYSELPQHFPKPGWVEHDANEIWEITRRVGREAVRNAGISPTSITGIGITNQRETSVIWDRSTGQPIAPAIVWQCRRTAEVCARLKKRGLETTVSKLTGLLLDPYFSATKFGWLLDHTAGARKRAKRGELACGTIDSWLIWKFTNGNVHATDYTNASRTMLFDIHRRVWSEPLLKLFRVEKSLLPEVRASAADFGLCASEHFGSPIPIRGVAGDQQAALYGHGATKAGLAKCTFGTGAFAVVFCGDKPVRSRARLLTTLACKPDGRPAYALEGSVFIAGAVMQWLRDGLGILRNAAESEAIARSVPDAGGVFIVPAFVGLGAPYWDAHARGGILGLSRGTTSAHIIRAALESIAYQAADLVDAMERDTGKRLKELRIDGGAAANDFLAQFLADILGLPVLRPSMVEMTAFGAASLAAVSLGSAFPARNGSEFTPFRPGIGPAGRRELKTAWAEAVRRVRSN